MAINGFWPWQIFYTGQELVIPQSGWTWPGNRALIPHPAQYVVGWNDTIYSVACFFGDVDPEALAAANGLQPPYRLQIGQVLNVP
jgi:LysM repeat protein